MSCEYQPCGNTISCNFCLHHEPEIVRVTCVKPNDLERYRWGNNNPAPLVIGQTYEVIQVEQHTWHTKLYLAEFPDEKGFNSVCFSNEWEDLL